MCRTWCAVLWAAHHWIESQHEKCLPCQHQANWRGVLPPTTHLQTISAAIIEAVLVTLLPCSLCAAGTLSLCWLWSASASLQSSLTVPSTCATHTRRAHRACQQTTAPSCLIRRKSTCTLHPLHVSWQAVFVVGTVWIPYSLQCRTIQGWHDGIRLCSIHHCITNPRAKAHDSVA